MISIMNRSEFAEFDAVLALQIMAGIVTASPVFLDADVNGDKRIGMAEVMVIFDKMLGKRPFMSFTNQ